MARLSLSLLGGFQARLAAGKPVILPTKKSQGLLAYLALRPGQAYPRDRLAALLWGDTAEEQARHSLRQALSDLRKALPQTKPETLRSNGDAVALNPTTVDVDVAKFERLVAEGTPQALAQAAALYQGDLLEGLSLKEEPWEEWLRAERQRLRELGVEALRRLLAHQTEEGATGDAIQTAGRLLAFDPLQEAIHRILMRLYLRQGRRGAALRQYQVCLEVLQRELGVEPEADTRRLYQELLSQPARPVQKPDSPSHRIARRLQRGSRWPRPPARTPETPLIGRASELDRLRQAMKEAWGGRGQVVVILGEGGIGKTRLIDELAVAALQRRGQVALGRCYETEQILSFGPWVDALRAGLKNHDLGGLSPVWQAELARLLPELEVPGIHLPASAEDYLRLFEAVVQLVGHLASREPLVLLLEDLHWADEMTVRLLSFLGRRIRSAPVLLVGTARDEELADAPLLCRTLEELDRDPRFLRLPLGPLSREDTIALVRALAKARGDGAAAERLGEQTWQASEGNPFMVVEIMRGLQEGGVVEPSGQLPMPDRVRQLVSGRLDRLSDRSQQLAAAAAVIGREFEFALLQRASALDEGAAAEGVEELVRRRVLRGSGERFDFTHDRIRETAYARLLPPRRRLLHGQVAQAIETVHADDLEPHYVALGTHCREGEVWDKACTYFRRAGGQAYLRSAPRAAATFYEQALDALRHLPETRATLEAGIDIRCDLRVALNPLEEDYPLLEHLRNAEDLARRLGDQRRLCRVLTYVAHELNDFGDYAQAIESAQRAVASARALGDSTLEISPTFFLGEAYYYLAEYHVAIGVLTGTIRSLEGDRAGQLFGLSGLPAVFSRTFLAYCLAALGKFGTGINVAEEGLRLAQSVGGPPYSLTGAYRGLAILYLDKGDLRSAISFLEPCLELARTRSIDRHIRSNGPTLAVAYALSGRLTDALPLIDEMATHGLGTRAKRAPDTHRLQDLGHACLLVGRLGDAATFLQRSLAQSREFKQRGFEAQSLRLLGEVTSRHAAPDFDGAEASYRRALTLAEALEMRPLCAHCHLGMGELYHRMGKQEQAQEHLSTATSMLREMNMGFWVDQAEAQLKALG